VTQTASAWPRHVAIVGATGGIGSALVARFAEQTSVQDLLALSRQRPACLPGKASWQAIDYQDPASVAKAFAAVPLLDLVIVASGLLHDGDYGPEKSVRALAAPDLERAFRVNAIGPALVASAVMSKMPRSGRAVFAALSARVGSISDNGLGGWYGYRASKAALNQLLRTFSIEWSRRNPDSICVALHPGTVDTRLSAPFQSGVAPEKLFTPGYAAERLIAVLRNLGPADTGGFFAWDGKPVPY
jgi:NAD(P)-dependent dehydrogenase (short-subunit alcohol dehydrogenase family)